MFLQTDDHHTVASSEASSHTLAAAPAGFEPAHVLREWALETINREAAIEEKEAKKKEAGMKQGDEEECMDESAELKTGQEKDASDGEDKDGGPGTVG